MNTGNPMKNYIIILRLAEEPDKALDRIKAVIEALEPIANGTLGMPFSTPGGFGLVGLLIQTTRTQKAMSLILRGQSEHTETSPLLDTDSWLILEIGDQGMALGMGQALRWLSGHRLPPA